MNDTTVTVVGNVVDSPRRVRLENGSVTNFRLASTARRYDRGKEEFVDGNTFWVDVECWNDLGGNVSHTVAKGDPVIVVGDLYTRQWESENGRRSAPQIRATAVGPNLARGIATFQKTSRPQPAAVEPASPPTEPPTDDEFADVSGLVPGMDYQTDPETLYRMDSDDTSHEPALA